MAKVTCRGADITEHVAAMFDAIVGSMDWGSGFLDVETIESIVAVAELAGFKAPTPQGMNPPGFKEWDGARDVMEQRPGHRARYEEYMRKRDEAMAAWCAQIRAKARAMATEEP